MLELSGVSKAFGGAVALEDVDFSLAPGEIHGLVGENGAGKSTLMKIIAGVHADYAGLMRMDGSAVRFARPAEAAAAGIGMVHQELSVIGALSVAENVFLGVQPTTRFGLVDWRRMRREARQLLARLGLDIDPAAPLGSLPLGLQQLVEIARVLFSGARVIILDEPTSALSPPEVARLFGVLRRLRDEGRSLIFISHFLDDVLEICDRVTVLRNARRIATEARASIDKAWLIDRIIGTGHDELGASYTGTFRLDSRLNAPVVLHAEGLGIEGAFRDVSLEVRAGEVLGIYGSLGAGQLELARALFGKLPAMRGSVSVDGRPVRLSSTARARRAGIAFVPESRRHMLFAQEPVYRNITIAMLARISRLLVRPGVERTIARAQTARFGIRPPDVDRLLRTLSGGNQQKVALARWLVDPPRVLMLSEPTRGMDVGAKEDVVRIVRGLRETGIGIAVFSTEPETILSLADRILVMRKGAVVGGFASEDISKDRLLAAA